MRSKRYWLRETIIGFFFGIFIVFVFTLVSMNDEPMPILTISLWDFLELALPIGIKFAIVGGIVGLINGKIKNRKK